jgi:hypothetical protein
MMVVVMMEVEETYVAICGLTLNSKHKLSYTFIPVKIGKFIDLHSSNFIFH